MNVVVIVQIERAVYLQRVVEELSLVADLVSDKLFRIVLGCVAEEDQVVATGSIAGSCGKIH